MSKCFVQISAFVALVYVDDTCWVLEINNEQPQKCGAPQMYNIRMNSLFEEMNMDEEYPFTQVRDLLKKKNCQSSMLSFSLTCMDSEMPLKLRKESASFLNDYTFDGNSQSAFVWLSELLLNTELPAGADINQEILDCMPQKFQELFRQMFKKYRDIDI